MWAAVYLYYHPLSWKRVGHVLDLSTDLLSMLVRIQYKVKVVSLNCRSCTCRIGNVLSFVNFRDIDVQSVPVTLKVPSGTSTSSRHTLS